VSECRAGAVNTFYIHPADFGIPKATTADLKGGDAARNAEIVTGILHGKKGPARDVVLLNAGVALFVAGRAADVREGLGQAARAIDSGAAQATLDKMVRSSQAVSV
jgi:anthranilate phosphoribosyltransferase